jgi:hypothetical protein
MYDGINLKDMESKDLSNIQEEHLSYSENDNEKREKEKDVSKTVTVEPPLGQQVLEQQLAQLTLKEGKLINSSFFPS